MPDESNRIAQILSSLDLHDVTGAAYPSGVVDPADRLRWNQARLVALALYHTHNPCMLPGEYTQELYAMATSIYSQSRTTFPTGTAEQLVEELASAVACGWL